MRRFGFAVAAALAMGAILGSVALARQAQTADRPAQSTSAAAAQVPGAGKAAELAAAAQIEPEALAKLVRESKGEKPVVLHVGFQNFYAQARIPGSDYAGPCSKPEGLELLRKRVESLPRRQFIALYCGCCPWDKCPNIKPAYEALRAMGFTNVKVVHIAQDFGANWVNAGLPVTRGQ